MITSYIDSNGEIYPFLAYEFKTRIWYVSKNAYGQLNNILTDKGSCAASILQFRPRQSKIKLNLSDAIKQGFGTDTFTVDDVGQAVNMNHIDLYWGEDDPLRGDPTTGIPAGLNCKLPVGNVCRCTLLKE